MITAVQMKMARAALNWPVKELADRVGVNANTIIRIEGGGDPKASIRDKIERVFMAEGIELGVNGSVRLIEPVDQAA